MGYLLHARSAKALTKVAVVRVVQGHPALVAHEKAIARRRLSGKYVAPDHVTRLAAGLGKTGVGITLMTVGNTYCTAVLLMPTVSARGLPTEKPITMED